MKTKTKKWQWITIIVLSIALLATIGLSMSAAWFQDSDSASSETQLGHAVTIRLKDFYSDSYGVEGWKEIYNSEKTQAYPGDKLISTTRIEMGSTTPALIRVKILPTVTTASGVTYTGSDFGEIALAEFDGVETPTEATGTVATTYYEKLIETQKTDTEYETNADNWNRFLLKNMTSSLALDEDYWKPVGEWVYYRGIFGDQNNPSQQKSNTIDLCDELILNPLLTNEVEQWTVKLELRVEAIQAAHRDDPTHPWYDDLAEVGIDEDLIYVQKASPASYFAYETAEDGNGIKITGLNEDAKKIVVPSAIDGVAVTEIAGGAFANKEVIIDEYGNTEYGNDTLEIVIIPSNIEKIDDYAFYRCISLRRVEFSSEVGDATTTGTATLSSKNSAGVRMATRSATTSALREIGEGAFMYCVNLEAIDIPEGVTSIGDVAFMTGNNEAITDGNLKTISLPSTLETIGEMALHLSGITKINLAEGNEHFKLENHCLVDLDNKVLVCAERGHDEIVVPDGVETIYAYTFTEGLTFVSAYVGYVEDEMMESLTIPESVTYVGPYQFAKTVHYRAVEASSDRDILMSSGMDGIFFCKTLYIENGVTCIPLENNIVNRGAAILYDDTIESFDIKVGTKYRSYLYQYFSEDEPTDAKYAYWHYVDGVPTTWEKPTYITDGNGTIRLSGYAMVTHSMITESSAITIPSQVGTEIITAIDEEGFYDCREITSITIPSGVKTIGKKAFYYCTGLTSITISNTVETIGDYAFSDCKNLTSITIPSSVTSIGEGAFDGWNMEWAYVWDGVSLENTGLEDVKYLAYYSETSPSDTSRLYWHYDGNNVSQVWETDVFYIEDGTLTGLTAYGKYISITTITIPSSVTAIGDYAFSGCESLNSVTIPNSVTSIGNGAFADCYNLSEITIPSSVTAIGDYAFSGCESLNSVTIPSSVETIGSYAFSNCYNLILNIQVGVTSIGEYAFEGCAMVNFAGSLEQWAEISLPESLGCEINYGA